MATVRCKPRRCMLRALDMCALPRFWAAQAGLAAFYTQVGGANQRERLMDIRHNKAYKEWPASL